MSTATREMIELMELLPEKDQDIALEFVRKLVSAWDPDYTKLTPMEKANLEQAMAETERVSHEEISWN